MQLGPAGRQASGASRFPHPAASSCPAHQPLLDLPWWQAPVLSGNTLPAHPDGMSSWTLSLLSARSGTGEQWHLSTLGCCFAALPGSDAGGAWAALQQHHKPQISSSFVKHVKKDFSTCSRSVLLPSSPSSPSPACPSSPSLVSSQPLSCPRPWVYLLPLSFLLLPPFSWTLWGTPVSSLRLAADFICPPGMVFIGQQPARRCGGFRHSH